VLEAATAVPTQPPVLVPTQSPTPALATPEVVENTPTDLAPATAAPTDAPTNTPEPVVDTAVVSSGVGVWLRSAPSTSGEQLEWLLDGTILTLLEGQQTADELLWQQVQTASGITGWVAADFIIVSE